MTAVNVPEPAQNTQRQHVLGRWVYSQSQSARLLRYGLAILAIVLALVRLTATVRSLVPPLVYRKDFLQEYTLARAIADGSDPYVPTEVLVARYVGTIPNPTFAHPTPHPPTLGILLLPLSLFDYSTAAILWFGLETVCLVASAYLLGRTAGARPSIGATLGIATALLIWYPFSVEMTVAQLQVPVLALLAGAWVALRSGRSLLGGALVGLAILLKPVPWPVLLWFVLRKDWRALVAALSVISGGYLVAGCVVGVDTLETYFTTVLPLVASTYRSAWGNFSISSLAWRVFHGIQEEGIMLVPPLIKSTLAAQVASIGLPVLLLLAAYLASRKGHDLDVSFALVVIVSILISPIAWTSYLVLTAIPAAHVIHWLLRHRLPSRETNWALVVAILLSVHWVELATFLALRLVAVRLTMTLPSALALLPLMTAVAVGALAWLVASLGPAESSMPVTVEN